jgi:acyl-CoA hydrolase
LRPDVLVCSLAEVTGGWSFTTEVGWQRAAVGAGARVVAVRRPGPVLEVHDPLPADDVLVLAESEAPPLQFRPSAATDVHVAIGEHVSRLVPEGARVQVGPGGLGGSVYAALRRPVHVDTGLLTDPLVDLDRRGLLLGRPLAPYAAGTDVLYDWAAATGRAGVCTVEQSHHPGRLIEGPPLVAVNTGLEIDLDGQIGAEIAAGSSVGGIGGQPDYAAAAVTSPDGISVFALPSVNGGRSTLVERLGGPVSTPGHEVEVVVTDRGVADLRGLSRRERRVALVRLWGPEAP